jgi:hypothetical protein
MELVVLFSRYLILTPLPLQTDRFTPVSYGVQSYRRQSLCGYADVADNPYWSLPSATVQLRLLACNPLRARLCFTIHTISCTQRPHYVNLFSGLKTRVPSGHFVRSN